MKARQWSEEKIISFLQQAEKGQSTIADLCRAHQVSENTFYKWRQKYGGLEVNQVKRLLESGTHKSREAVSWK